MKHILVYLLLFLCVLHNQNVCLAQNIIQQNVAYVEDLSLALKLSKDTGQKVLLVFSADWCAYCSNLKNDLSKLDNLDNKIICILDTDSHTKLSKKFKVKTLPMSFILDSDGNSLFYIKGYDFNSYNEWLSQQ